MVNNTIYNILLEANKDDLDVLIIKEEQYTLKKKGKLKPHEMDVAAVYHQLGCYDLYEVKTTRSNKSKCKAMHQLDSDLEYMLREFPEYKLRDKYLVYNRKINCDYTDDVIYEKIK